MPAENIKHLKAAGINLLAGTFLKKPWEEIFFDLKKFIQKMKPDLTIHQNNGRKKTLWIVAESKS